MIPTFTKQVIATIDNNIPPYPMNTFLAAGDINGSGRIDLLVSGRHGRMVWLENLGNDRFTRHTIDDTVQHVECGGSLFDLTGVFVNRK